MRCPYCNCNALPSWNKATCPRTSECDTPVTVKPAWPHGMRPVFHFLYYRTLTVTSSVIKHKKGTYSHKLSQTKTIQTVISPKY